MSERGGVPEVDALAEVAHELYALPPSEFVAARDERVRAARDAGDRELARAVATLARPVVAAWAVNLLARHEPDLVRQVLEVGEALREAQAGLEGEALRELGRQRRELVGAVVARAAALVADEGGRLAGAAEQQVGATLHAALAEPAAAEAVLSGCLVKPLESTGLGGLDLGGHVASVARGTPPAPPAPRAARAVRPAGRSTDDEASQQAQVRAQAEERRRLRREAAQRRVAEAERESSDAERALADVRRRHEEQRAHLLHLEALADELRRRLDDLEAQAEEASRRVEASEDAVSEAAAGADRARSALASVREALADLGD